MANIFISISRWFRTSTLIYIPYSKDKVEAVKTILEQSSNFFIYEYFIIIGFSVINILLTNNCEGYKKMI